MASLHHHHIPGAIGGFDLTPICFAILLAFP
jgi:hypothetical protein